MKQQFTLEIYMNNYIICVQVSNNVFKSSLWLTSSNKYKNWNSIRVYSYGGNLLNVYKRGEFIPQYPEQNSSTEFFKNYIDVIYLPKYDKNSIK